VTRFALILFALGVACGGSGEPPGPAPAPHPEPPRDAAVADAQTRFVGVLAAAESVDLAPRVAGTIAKVHVGAGDVVAAGQIVASMDPAQLRDELRAAEASLAAASAASRSAGVDVEDARRKVALETRAVADGVSPGQLLEEVRMGLRRAEAALQRAISTQAVEAARAQTARDHLADAELRAPFAGTIEKRYRDAGNRVEAGAPIVRIVGHGGMRLRFAVPLQLVPLVRVSTRVTATVDTLPAPVTAVVTQVSPTLDPSSGLIFVEAQLVDQPAGELRYGLAAWVEL
jgi:RND family efflux transporter MFP subunit